VQRRGWFGYPKAASTTHSSYLLRFSHIFGLLVGGQFFGLRFFDTRFGGEGENPNVFNYYIYYIFRLYIFSKSFSNTSLGKPSLSLASRIKDLSLP